MLLEIFMNLTEISGYVFIMHAFFPITSKKTNLWKTLFFIVYMTAGLCLMTFLNLSTNQAGFIFTFAMLYLYTILRDSKATHFKRLIVTSFTTFLLFYSLSVGFTGIHYITSGISLPEMPELLLLLSITRGTFFLLAGIVIALYNRRLEGFHVSNRQLLLAGLIFFLYSFITILIYELTNSHSGDVTVVNKVMAGVGLLPIIFSSYFYYSLRENHLKSQKALETQKQAYDSKNIHDYAENLQSLNAIKEELIELMTPVVQTLNELGYDETREMLEDFLGEINQNTNGVSQRLDSKIQAAIRIKVEECQQMNIRVTQSINTSKQKPAIFNNTELLMIITNLFDISMTECNTKCEKPSLNFIFEALGGGILMEMKYPHKFSMEAEADENAAIAFLPETLLKQALSKLGGYTTCMKSHGIATRKVLLPYAGKSYYLGGADIS